MENTSASFDIDHFQSVRAKTEALPLHNEAFYSRSHLPNDTCQETLRLEVQFFSKYNLQPYEYAVDDVSTVIYSRTLATHYRWPADKPLTIAALQTFSETGHTLGIDNTRSYARLFALDLDCICRVEKGVNHMSDGIVLDIAKYIRKIFAELLNIKRQLNISIWKNACCYHIYTNIFMTLPTHLLLKKIIEVEFHQSFVVFEVPSTMPLPYSAKVKGAAYQSLVLVDKVTQDMPLTMTDDPKFIEMFEYSRLFRQGQSIGKIESFSDITYVTRTAPYIRRSAPRLVKIKTVQMYKEFEYMDQLRIYIEKLVSTYHTQMTTIGDLDFSAFDENIRFRIAQFMTQINNMFDIPGVNRSADVPDSCVTFIQLCTVDNGGLYMQHFVGALYKFLDLKDYNEFRSILAKIFSNAVHVNRTTKQFVETVDKSTMQAYVHPSEDILKHLHYLIRHGVNPCDSFNDQINTILCSISKESSYEAVADKFRQTPRNKHDILLDMVWGIFTEVIAELAIMYYDHAGTVYRYLHPIYGTYYESKSNVSIDELPPIFSRWLGIAATTTTINTQLKNQIIGINYKETFDWVKTDFMYATNVGVFNIVTGEYSASTKFLKFSKFAYYGLWDVTIGKSQMFLDQNEHIRERMDIAYKYANMMITNVFPFYLHGFIAPALIQLRRLMSVDESVIRSLMEKFTFFTDYTEAFFLLEYFPIEPKFIYLLLHIMATYGGSDTLQTYKHLCLKILSYEVSSEEIWRTHFKVLYNSVTYDASKSTYLEQLMSMQSSEGVLEFNESGAFIAVLIAACMFKCRSFRPFLCAFFNSTQLPDIRTEHPDYHDFSYNTNLEAMRTNLNRAIRIVCGDSLSVFEKNIIYECISANMSTNFIPLLTLNYLDAIAAAFPVSNLNKKFILFHGPGDAGKSFTCNKLQEIKNPSIVRLLNLDNMARAQITTKNLITIINEATKMEAACLKTITGNDAVSSQRFFSQVYDMQLSQSLLYGATNNHIKFLSNNDTDIDRTTIERLHCVNMTGIIVEASEEQPNFITMLIDGKFFKNIIPLNLSEASSALAWIAYGVYVLRRSEIFHPRLDTTNYYSREYQRTVYFNNSKLYKILHNSGIVDEKNFVISSQEILTNVRRYLETTSSSSSKDMEIMFVQRFSTQYGIDLYKNTEVKHFVARFQLDHIQLIMHAIDSPGAEITEFEYDQRINMYASEYGRRNAKRYFDSRYQKYYDYVTQTYKNIEFKIQPFAFGDNVKDIHAPLKITPDALIMKDL